MLYRAYIYAMSLPVSVVIISLNAAATIQKTIRSARRLTDDVVVVDSGSTDGTTQLALAEGARLVAMPWQGYGANKNRGNAEARHDWVLSLDADEELSDELTTAIRSTDLAQKGKAYRVKRLNYLNQHPVYHGEWSNDWTTRLFNRTEVRWDDTPVHENLLIPDCVSLIKLTGWLHHYTAPDIETYQQKLDRYADLAAHKYLASGKQAPAYKIYLSPVFSFIKHYVVRGGWLDKKAGWQIALAHAGYTFRKYKKLRHLVAHPETAAQKG